MMLGLVCLTASAASLADASADEWQFQVTPYLWLPTIDGTVNFELPPGGGGSPDVSIGPTDWLELLNFGALIGSCIMRTRGQE